MDSIDQLIFLQACSPHYSYKESAVPEPVQLSNRLRQLFSNTKLVCFGRYALEIPGEAQIIWGNASYPSKKETRLGGMNASKDWAERDIINMKQKEKTAEINYFKPGPVDDSWQIRYYESESHKSEGLYFFNTYITKKGRSFLLRSSVRQGETENITAARETQRAKGLRLRGADEVPTEPGYCIEHGFMLDTPPASQEMVDVGIFLPSFADVSFSLSSNKDAYGDYSAEEFEKKRLELSLLDRIQQAKNEQGSHYPSRTLLREGKRDVQHWHGEESLIRRQDGTHDFEWSLVGTPQDVANPSDLGAQMFTKVEHNLVGAAKSASLSDDEAIALWDKLLGGLKFRVKVPGAPPGSYYYPQGDQLAGGAK